MTSGLELSQEEISSAQNPEYSVVDVTGTRLDSVTVLKFGFRNRETEVISLNKAAIENLIAVLKSIVPYFDAIEGTSITVDVNTGRSTNQK
jgi:hypothetical protein